MTRIGLIADTHDEVVPWGEVHAKVAKAFEGVELILHCGDLTTLAVLDELESIAPVVAVRSAADPAATARLLEGPHVLEIDGTVIGLVNSLGEDGAADFGRPVDVVVHGGTHAASVEPKGSVLLVNPGSPTLANELTVGLLDVGDDGASAVIVALDGTAKD